MLILFISCRIALQLGPYMLSRRFLLVTQWTLVCASLGQSFVWICLRTGLLFCILTARKVRGALSSWARLFLWRRRVTRSPSWRLILTYCSTVLGAARPCGLKDERLLLGHMVAAALPLFSIALCHSLVFGRVLLPLVSMACSLLVGRPSACSRLDILLKSCKIVVRGVRGLRGV